MSLDDYNRAVLFQLYDKLTTERNSVFLAARDFPTKDVWLKPRASMDLVFNEIKSSDLFVLYVSNVAQGALIELGYAIATRIPIIVITTSNDLIPYMIKEGYEGMSLNVISQPLDSSKLAEISFTLIQKRLNAESVRS